MDFFSRLTCHHMAEDEQYIYYYADEASVLCRLDKETKENSILLELKETVTYAYSPIQKVGEKLVLMPLRANDIIVYDLEQGTFEEIPLEIPGKYIEANFKNEFKFWNSFVFAQSVCMLGFDMPIILKLDLLTMQIQYLTEIWDCIKSEQKIQNVYFVDGMVLGKSAWISCACCNMMIELNLESMKIECHRLSLIEKGCGIFTYDGKDFWIGEWALGSTKLLRWNPKENVEKEYQIKETSKATRIHNIIVIRECVYINFFDDEVIYRTNKTESIIEKVQPNVYCNEICDRLGWKVSAMMQYENGIRYVTGDKLWHEYEFKTKKHVEYEIKMENTKFLEHILNRRVRDDILYKEGYGDLLPYIKLPISVDREEKKNTGLIQSNVFSVLI